MNILLLLKAVADSEANIKPAADGKSVALDGISWILNPYDEYAVEEALKLRDADGSGEVVAVSVGGDDVSKVLRTALAMGVDRGVHVKGDVSFDPLATAQVLAAAVKGMNFAYDLILCGKQGIDHDHHGVGVMVAELLDIPSVTVVVKIEKAASGFRCEREVESGVEVVETSLPCLIAANKGLNEPRYASLKGIMAAKKKPIDEVTPAAIDPQIEVISVTSRPPRQPGEIIGHGVDAIPLLIKKLKEEAKVI
ncbi:electron transfer flavoprotein subunit beta/FixA family protein [candidate division KSB1 bacterium]|nr:electron transfer flavoprotein subunit beta/FixA family protein [candidate division KSB1 bacterium]